MFICNKFDKDAPNALISPQVSLKFNVNEYVEKVEVDAIAKCSEIAQISGLKKVSFLVI